ncbi:MAG: sugar phosphate isomerase/epimerase [Limnochordaceae bacterium]|nr:sugar phosphate isomerase/epimerase [Limnochordaceae bacterium]
MKKGINHWCFPASYSIESAAKLAVAAGFDSFEINVVLPPSPAGGAATGGQEGSSARAGDVAAALGLASQAPGGQPESEGDVPTALTTTTRREQAERLAACVRGLGLELSSLSTALLWQYPLSSPDPAQRQKGIEIVEAMLQLAEWMRIGAILVVPGVVTPDSPYDQVWERSQAALRQLAAKAAQHRVVIGVENVWNKFLLSPLEFARFIDDIDSPWVGAYFDIGNVLVNGYPDQWIRLLGKRIQRCHVKDFRTDVGTIQGFVPLLQGHVPWTSVVKALQEIGYDGYLTAELSPYPTAPDQLIQDTAAALRRILALAQAQA